MSESMITRVARAIYEVRNGAGCKPWPHITADHQGPYLKDARAALEAMRLPTEAMLASAWREITADKKAAGIARLGPGPGVSDWWQAMIDAALSEKTP